jgi:hypothetical protein
VPSDFAHAFQRFPRAAKPTPWRAMQQWAHIRRMIDMNHQSQTANNLFFLLNVAKKTAGNNPYNNTPFNHCKRHRYPRKKQRIPFSSFFAYV